MFVLRKNLTCRWPVKVIEPHPENPGETQESEFTVDFLLLGRDQREENDRQRSALIQALQDATEPSAIEAAKDALKAYGDDRYAEVIKGWSGIEDENGPVSFSPENLKLVLGNDYVRRALDAAYYDAITLDKARLGN